MSTPTAAPRPTLASFWHDLPREGRLMLSVVVFEFLGTGLVLPFHVVYLHEVRGFALSDVGLLLGLPPLAGFLVVGPGGALIDRLGARVIVLTVLSLLIAGDVLLAFAETLPVAGFALMLSGIAFGVSWPAFQSFIAAVVPPELRQRYFGVSFSLLNLGIGIGGIVGGVVVDVDRAVTFQGIYLADAVSYLPSLFLMLVPLRHVAGRVQHDPEEVAASGGGGYLAVLRRPAVAPLMVLSFVSSFVGYSQLNAGMPAFARAVGEVSTRGLGFAFAANTVVIVLLQLVVLHRIEGRRRTRVIAVMSVLWSLSWLLLGASGLVPGTLGATLLVAACASVFALGETLLQPTIPALVNDLAPDHLRGRYNALSSASFSLAAIIAPPIAGALVGHHLGNVYIGLLVAGALVCGALAVLHVEPQLPPAVNGVRPPTTADAEEPAFVPTPTGVPAGTLESSG
ncbi:MFS transporter [Nocardioides sp. LS1]|uniref:MFS transporter n=1 Tax=Nocardioides sp. LS1 TaxID=1027620 RepID=UPI000F620C4D|nr:MFS transporter [Nocardioides sp. LS1]GCD90798.1 MFS transporter [Nocardioides sp. LS1]